MFRRSSRLYLRKPLISNASFLKLKALGNRCWSMWMSSGAGGNDFSSLLWDCWMYGGTGRKTFKVRWVTFSWKALLICIFRLLVFRGNGGPPLLYHSLWACESWSLPGSPLTLVFNEFGRESVMGQLLVDFFPSPSLPSSGFAYTYIYLFHLPHSSKPSLIHTVQISALKTCIFFSSVFFFFVCRRFSVFLHNFFIWFSIGLPAHCHSLASEPISHVCLSSLVHNSNLIFFFFFPFVRSSMKSSTIRSLPFSPSTPLDPPRSAFSSCGRSLYFHSANMFLILIIYCIQHGRFWMRGKRQIFELEESDFQC